MVTALLWATGSLQAAEQAYDYDALGRLVRSTADGNSVEYRYDPAGNLLEVTGNLPVVAPAITAVSPNALRRGQSALIELSGTGLAYASVNVASPAFIISSVNARAATLSFNLTVAADAPLGAHTFSVSNAAGSATFSFAVNPALPQLSVAPLPLAVAPDSTPRSFVIALSNADSVGHSVNLATSNPAIATVSPASLSIAPGQTSVLASLTGITGGSTTLTLTSPTLQSIAAPVFVTAEFAGINTSHAALLGVVLVPPDVPPTTQSVQLGGNADVGVVIGGHLRDIAPDAVAQGASASFTLFGKGLETATSVSLVPADGATLGTLTAAPDGLSATLPITLAADAPTGLRQLVLADSVGNRFPASHADSDRVLIAHPAPEIESITPLFGTVGAPVGVTLRGRNLQQGKVQLSPGTGIQVDGAPLVSADGTQMAFKLGIGSLTALGAHIVRVVTPGGASAEAASSANTYTVVTATEGAVEPVVAPQLGVVLETAPVPVTRDLGLAALNLGLAFGPTVTGVAPRAGIVGETLSLVLQGQELAAASALELSPATGVSVLALTPAADGKSVNASLAIAADAPRTVRTLRLLAGASALPFSDPAASQFRVTAPQPRLDSVTPINLATGSGPITLSLRGVHFREASEVTVLPASDVSVSQPPVVNADATEISVNLTVAPGAATGPRVLGVVTPAGRTDSLATPANTIRLVTTLGDAITPIAAPVLGVLKLDDSPPPSFDSLLASSDLGVVLQAAAAPPPTQDIFLGNARLGVALGPVALGVTATALRPGIGGTLSVSGVGLDGVTTLSVVPATGITLGTPTIQPDGLAVSVPVTLAADAAAGARELTLTSGATPVLFADAAAARFVVAAGAPRIDSISPILARQGETVTLTVRGAHLERAVVQIEPASGVILGSAPVVNAAGTELSIAVHIPADAALGGRVIRVQTPGGITPDQAEPANTFTVFPP